MHCCALGVSDLASIRELALVKYRLVLEGETSALGGASLDITPNKTCGSSSSPTDDSKEQLQYAFASFRVL